MSIDTRQLLHQIADACRNDDRARAATLLSFVPPGYLAELQRYLDSSSILTLNMWSLLD